MPFRAADISTMLRDSPDSITNGAVTAKCWVDDRDDVVQEGGPGQGQKVRVVTALVSTADFPAVDNGAAVTVNGTAYTVHSALAMDDGAVTELVLVKA